MPQECQSVLLLRYGMNAEKTIQIVGVQTAEGEDASSDDLRGKFHPFFLSFKKCGNLQYMQRFLVIILNTYVI